MIAKRFLIAFGLLLAAILLIIGLDHLSPEDHYSGGFTRIFSFPKPVLLHTVDLKTPLNYLAGVSADAVYIANYARTAHLLQYQLKTGQLTDIPLQKTDTGKLAWKLLHIQVDSPFLYLMEGLTPAILYAPLNDNGTHRVALRARGFTASLALSPYSYILRTLDPSLNQYILTKEETGKKARASFVLEKQGEGVFSLDGMLLKNQEENHLVYLYYYSNRFYCLDSNLKLLYGGRTLDTIAHPHLQLSEIRSEHALTLSAPPLVVNKAACLDNDILLVNSAIKGAQESKDLFTAHSVVDVYALSSGRYLSSFYLENPGGFPLTDMRLLGDQLITVNDRYLRIYQLERRSFLSRSN